MASPRVPGSGADGFRSLARSKTGNTRPVVLLTGFGPFPGVKRNASADVVQELARLCVERLRDVSVTAAILPVEWTAGPQAVAELLAIHRPAVALHFGVSARASGFVIEQHAYNEALATLDESGRMADASQLVPGDRPRRTATVPVRAAVGALRRAGFPARLSNDPGRYLCNAVLFHSLRHSARAASRVRTGFIHIPATLDPAASGTATVLGWNDAVGGGLTLLETCLAPLRGERRSLS